MHGEEERIGFANVRRYYVRTTRETHACTLHREVQIIIIPNKCNFNKHCKQEIYVDGATTTTWKSKCVLKKYKDYSKLE